MHAALAAQRAHQGLEIAPRVGLGLEQARRRKFFPAEARHHAAFRLHRPHRSAYGLQDIVARRVAVLVVDALEIVDIGNPASQDAFAQRGPCLKLLGRREERPPVRQARQLVTIGQPVIGQRKPLGFHLGPQDEETAGRRDDRRQRDTGNVDRRVIDHRIDLQPDPHRQNRRQNRTRRDQRAGQDGFAKGRRHGQSALGFRSVYIHRDA